jgi:hypothetical protein
LLDAGVSAWGGLPSPRHRAKRKTVNFTKLYTEFQSKFGLTKNETLILSEILRIAEFRAKKQTLAAIEASGQYLMGKAAVSLRTLNRALATFKEKELLSYEKRKNQFGRAVRWITIINADLAAVVLGDGAAAKDAVKKAQEQVIKVHTRQRDLDRIFESFNAAKTYPEKLDALDKMALPVKFFIYAWDHIYQKVTGRRFVWARIEFAHLYRVKAFECIKTGNFNYGELEEYGSWCQRNGEISLQGFLSLWRDGKIKNPRTLALPDLISEMNSAGGFWSHAVEAEARHA